MGSQNWSNPWTDAEIDKVKVLLSLDEKWRPTTTAIGERLGRSKSSVVSMCNRQGITIPRRRHQTPAQRRFNPVINGAVAREKLLKGPTRRQHGFIPRRKKVESSISDADLIAQAIAAGKVRKVRSGIAEGAAMSSYDVL